jgi:hypothetical protein
MDRGKKFLCLAALFAEVGDLGEERLQDIGRDIDSVGLVVSLFRNFVSLWN